MAHVGRCHRRELELIFHQAVTRFLSSSHLCQVLGCRYEGGVVDVVVDVVVEGAEGLS